MATFTILYVKRNPLSGPEFRNQDNTVYTATVTAKNENDARAKFEKSFMQPSMVRGIRYTPKKNLARPTVKKVGSPIRIVRVYSGDGVRTFTSYRGNRKFTERAVMTMKTKYPRRFSF